MRIKGKRIKHQERSMLEDWRYVLTMFSKFQLEAVLEADRQEQQ